MMNLRNKLRQLSNLSHRVYPYFDLPAIGQAPLPSVLTPPGFVFDGALPDLASMAIMLQALLAYAPANGPLSAPNFQTSAAASITLTNLFNLYQRLTTGAACTVTLDYAYNIVNQVPFPFLGQNFGFQISGTAATTVAAPTLSDTAVTLSGTTTVTTGGFRNYQVTITQLATQTAAVFTTGTTFTSITQVGSTNAFTVALGTNAISPTVGSAMFINVTAGTLPTGWYPIVKVNSATSIVIATPPGTVWTATAATVGIIGTTVINTIPTTPIVVGGVTVPGYSQGLTLLPGQAGPGVVGQQGIYSPLITVNGMMGMAAGVMVV
jgi:hypothetical protein